MPHEDFDPEIEQLASAHEKAEATMLQLILAYLTGRATYEQATQGIGQIAEALAGASAEWVQGVLPRIYADGMDTAQEALQGDEDGPQQPPNTQAHSASLRLFQEDLAADLAATTNRMNDDAKASLRNLARQQITEMMASGKNAIPQAREMAAQMEEKGVRFTDRSGRRWKPRDYSRMVLRTKAVEVSNQANVSAAREFGSKVMRIFDGGPSDNDAPCLEANGQVWTHEYFATHLLEHPNCRRAGSPLPSTYSGKVDRE